MFDLSHDPNASPTKETLQVALQRVYPSAPVQLLPYIGGELLRVKIWQFYIDLDLTVNPTYQGKAGSVRMQFKWVRPQGQPIILDQGNSDRIEPVLAFVYKTRAYLDGIVIAISMACEMEDDPE